MKILILGVGRQSPREQCPSICHFLLNTGNSTFPECQDTRDHGWRGGQGRAVHIRRGDHACGGGAGQRAYWWMESHRGKSLLSIFHLQGCTKYYPALDGAKVGSGISIERSYIITALPSPLNTPSPSLYRFSETNLEEYKHFITACGDPTVATVSPSSQGVRSTI